MIPEEKARIARRVIESYETLGSLSSAEDGPLLLALIEAVLDEKLCAEGWRELFRLVDFGRAWTLAIIAETAFVHREFVEERRRFRKSHEKG